MSDGEQKSLTPFVILNTELKVIIAFFVVFSVWFRRIHPLVLFNDQGSKPINRILRGSLEPITWWLHCFFNEIKDCFYDYYLRRTNYWHRTNLKHAIFYLFSVKKKYLQRIFHRYFAMFYILNSLMSSLYQLKSNFSAFDCRCYSRISLKVIRF